MREWKRLNAVLSRFNFTPAAVDNEVPNGVVLDLEINLRGPVVMNWYSWFQTKFGSGMQ